MKSLLRLLCFICLGLPALRAQDAEAPARRDPFAFQAPAAGSGGLVAAPPGAVPAGIRVLGILAMDGQPPMAALALPGKEHPVFVRENDVIQIDETPAANRPRRGAEDPLAREESRQLYLLITRVTASEVELAPRTRPEEIRIYR